jgi:hypothetical protein
MLQSASSFLNGLSTSRRLAGPNIRTTDSSWVSASADEDFSSQHVSCPASRPATTRPPSAAQLNASMADMSARRHGHTFKSNGFAISRPLNVMQLRCYRQHARLLPSQNKHAPVECAVCHTDDGGEHFSCTWCALRMCKYCRRDFAEHGITALKDRIRKAELAAPPNSSTENLGRSRSKAYA